MKDMENSEELYLLVDIDDFLVRSSDKLQEILNEKTNFRTNTLKMLEQLNRNCKYVYREVKEECQRAKELGIVPDLSRFNLFDNNYNSQDEMYIKPVLAMEYYVKLASSLLNQFLEERDSFLENDNLPKGEIKNFDYQKELDIAIKYSNYIDKNYDAITKINKFCLAEAKRLIEEARSKNIGDKRIVPNYRELVSMDTNDILKKNSINQDDDFYKENVLYFKPLYDISNAILLQKNLYDIVRNVRVFDTKSREIVDYKEIHSLANVNWDAVKLVKDLIRSGKFKGVYFSTHHNGDREEKAKIELMKQILPEASGFLGQRFHNEEHTGERRDRSSKIDTDSAILNVPKSCMVLLDDSKANCGDCKKKEGIEILYKPMTDSEIIKGSLEETGFNRILSFDYDSVCEYIEKSKQKKL